jgi:hypothetical protein
LAALLWGARVALAQEGSGDRATSFEAVEGPPKEDVPGGPLLIGAYAFVLVLLIGYVARIGALQAKTARELERLTRALDQPGRRAKE